MRKKFLLFILLFVISSCDSTTENECYVADPSKCFVFRNGDLTDEKVTSYSDFSRDASAEDILHSFQMGFQPLFFIYNTTCKSCNSLLPIVESLEIHDGLEIFYFNVRNGLDEIYKLIDLFPNGNIQNLLSSITTPSMFLIKSSLCAEKIDLTNIKKEAELHSRIIAHINITNVYTFQTYRSFVNAKKNDANLIYFINFKNHESNTFFDKYIATKSKYSSQNTYLIRWEKLSEIDKNNFNKIFNLNNDFEVVVTCNQNIKMLQKHSYISELSEAINLVHTYFKSFL